MSTEIEVPSIRDRDLNSILQHFGLKDAMDEGTINCENCSRSLSWENLGAMLSDSNSIILYCNLSECIETAVGNSRQ